MSNSQNYSKFNQQLWDIGRKMEDKLLPHINLRYDCKFERNENDIWDIFDFMDPHNNCIVEIKSRRIKSTQFKDTIITANKINEGYKKLELGYQVFYIFVFTDTTYELELKEDMEFRCQITGTNSIAHYLIPIQDMIEIDFDD
tara:strand:+ start:1225 stop:1653 length:429 start_codon:yes stop_codon:yes gene_type:complete